MTHRPILSIASGALMLAIALPASAQQAPRQNVPAGASASVEGSEPDARNRRICVKQQTVGTRLTRKICRAQWQWEQEGGIPTDER